MELDYVYRSRKSDMAPVADCVWLSDELLAVAFRTGLVELVDVDSRSVLSSVMLEGKTLLSIAAVGNDRLIVQTKADSVSLYDWTQWKCLWTISTSTAVTFARPCVLNDQVAFVCKAQGTVAIVTLDTGYVEATYDLTSTGAAGMTVALACSPTAWATLTESGHLIHFTHKAGSAVDQQCQPITLPQGESVIPTALHVDSSGEAIIGFSNGEVLSAAGAEFFTSQDSGIGALTKTISGRIVGGTWRGHIFPSNDQPHCASIVKVAAAASRVAIASTDGRVSLWDLIDSPCLSGLDQS